MAIVTETFEINGRQFIRTYSDAGKYIIGGSPENQYVEAVDPAAFNRSYVEGELIPNEAQPKDYENALSDLGVSFDE